MSGRGDTLNLSDEQMDRFFGDRPAGPMTIEIRAPKDYDAPAPVGDLFDRDTPVVGPRRPLSDEERERRRARAKAARKARRAGK